METQRTTTRAVTAAVGALVSLAVIASAAQQPQIAERVDVARVIIDVRVVDGRGRPILGLEPADFEVRIGGEPVAVESAQWFGIDAPADGPLPSTAIAGALEPEPPGRLIVFVVQKSLERNRAVGLLRLLMDSDRLLTRVTPDDRIAVLSFDSHLKIWLDFTDDVDRVRTVLADEVMFGAPPTLEPHGELSLLAALSQDVGRRTYEIQEALLRLGNALEPLPGSKSVVLIGYGFGELTVTLGIVGSILDNRYNDARAALEAARATVFSLDVTQADYHTFEHGLQAVAADTGGFFARTHLFARHAIDRVANAISGHYVLFTERPDVEPGNHPIRVDLVERKGTVLARSTYVE